VRQIIIFGFLTALLPSCARPGGELAPGVLAVCESSQSPIKNALAEMVREGFSKSRQDDPPDRRDQLHEPRRQELIKIMKRMAKRRISSDQECKSFAKTLCKATLYCTERVPNDPAARTRYTLLLEKVSGSLVPLQLTFRFEDNSPNPRTGKIDESLIFENGRLWDIMDKLDQEK
jgi:hypothetical protein